MKKISVEKLEKVKDQRPEGYVKAVQESGFLRDGFYYLENHEWEMLQRHYLVASKAKPRGLGDVVAKFAKPIARTIDRVAGTNLENCTPCKKRQEKLNQMFPNK
jgi:hypothetical protein